MAKTVSRERAADGDGGPYYDAFRAVVKESDPGAVMCSYNQINGTQSCNNEAVQSKQHEWGSRGHVVPDAVFALHDSLQAIHAGVDEPGTVEKLKELLDSKMIDEAVIDRMLANKRRRFFGLASTTRLRWVRARAHCQRFRQKP
jgi:beta-glucosidase